MIDNLLTNRVNVTRSTASPGISGGEVDTNPTLLYIDLPASIQPISSKWQVIYSQRNILTTHSVYLNQIADIQIDDVITYKTRTFRVMGVRNLIQADRVLVVDCQEFFNGN